MIDWTIFKALFTIISNFDNKFLCVSFFGSPSKPETKINAHDSERPLTLKS